jgi:formylmethanofuran dehydrogenase subunit C
MNTTTQLSAGQKITNSKAFVSPIGAYFAAGSVFTVEVVGTVNTRCRANMCGSVVWVMGNEIGDIIATDAWR